MDDPVYDYVCMQPKRILALEDNDDYMGPTYATITENNAEQVEVIEDYSSPVNCCLTQQIANTDNDLSQMEVEAVYSTPIYDSLDENIINMENSSPKMKVFRDFSIPHYNCLTEYSINTDDFSASDLQQFVDSLETLTRLNKAKYEKRQRFKKRSFEESFEYSKRIITCLDTSLVINTTNDDSNGCFNLSHESNNDEVHYSVLDQNQTSNSALFSYSNMDSLKSISFATSEESGIFFNNTVCQEHLYENSDLIGSKKKSKSFRSRLMSCILRKRAKSKTLPKDLDSDTTICEQSEGDPIYEQIWVNDDAKPQESSKNRAAKKEKKKYRNSKNSRKNRKAMNANEKLINKAMRFLTL